MSDHFKMQMHATEHEFNARGERQMRQWVLKDELEAQATSSNIREIEDVEDDAMRDKMREIALNLEKKLKSCLGLVVTIHHQTTS